MIERILAATDGSDASTAALRHARDLAASTGAALTVLHVRTGPADNPEDARRAEAILEEAAGTVGARAELLLAVAAGRRVADVIAGEAERLGASLLVIGSHGIGGHDPHLLGSVAERVSHNAAPRVLIVRGGHQSATTRAAWSGPAVG